jgi:arabinogalactan endo-1,4-beta-galactosidase
MGFLIGFHFSDTWTSPGHQAKPSAWRKMTFDEMTKALHDWVKDTLVALRDNGTPPQIAKIGNEMSDGILKPDGSRNNFDQFSALVKAGCAASREVDPRIQIALHHHLGRDNATVVAWVDNFLARKTDFDIITMSCYAEARKGQDWKNNFNDLALRYPRLKSMCQEYSALKRELNDVVFNAPNEQGLGSFIWEPTRWMEAIFDKDGQNAGGQQNGKPHLKANPMPGVAVASEPATPPAQRYSHRFHGGRYDTNAYALQYLEMAKAYGLDRAIH